MRIAEHAIALIVRGLDPEDGLLRDVTDVWSSFDRIERLVASAKTLLAARVDEAGAWKQAGARSAADHMAKLGGTTAHAARSAVESAGGCDRGRRHGRSIGGGTVVAHGAVDQCRGIAGGVFAHEGRGDPDPDATYRRIHAERRLRFSTDPEGGRNLVARGAGDRVSRIEKALEPVIDDLFKDAWAEGRREPREAYAFDALVMLTEQDPASESTKKCSSKPRYPALLQLPFEALVRGAIEGEETCEIVGRVRSARTSNVPA